jgi:broad specificity phosphatase PhoE
VPTTRLLLVRHGATVLSAEDRFAGSSDVELSDEGRRQADALGRRLEGEGLVAVYASPMKRTRETAERAAAGYGLVPEIRDGLREIDHGRWEGLRRAEVEERFPDEYVEIVTAHPGERVLVVSHKATIRLAIASLLGFDPRGYRDRLDQLPCCLNILDFKDPVRARLALFNDVSHYAEEPAEAGPRLSKWWDR